MGSNCCHSKQKELEATAARHKTSLWTVLVINLAMFFVEIFFGVISNSVALLADSLDMLGDAITYGSSIVVVSMSVMEKVKVAKLKAWIMLIFGLSVSVRCIYKGFFPEVPNVNIMFYIAGLALLANIICLMILSKHRNDDINMKSVWICSRNDIIANSSVIGAGILVYFLNSSIPDLIVGVGLSILFAKSALGIFEEVKQQSGLQ